MNPHEHDLRMARDHHRDLIEEASRRRLAGPSHPRRPLYRRLRPRRRQER